MYNVTYDHMRTAFGGASSSSLANWTKGLPTIQPSVIGKYGGSGPKKFRLDEVITQFRSVRRAGLAGAELRRLLDAAPNNFDPAQPLGDDLGKRAYALFMVLTRSEEARLDRAAVSFEKGCTYAFWDRRVHVPMECSTMLPLCLPVLRYVMLADRSTMPATEAQWGEFAAATVIANSPSPCVALLAGSQQ